MPPGPSNSLGFLCKEVGLILDLITARFCSSWRASCLAISLSLVLLERSENSQMALATVGQGTFLWLHGSSEKRDRLRSWVLFH